jgi:hypothetical protein
MHGVLLRAKNDVRWDRECRAVRKARQDGEHVHHFLMRARYKKQNGRANAAVCSFDQRDATG